MCIICSLTQTPVIWRHWLSNPSWMHRKYLIWLNRTFWIKGSWTLLFHKIFANSIFFMDLLLSNCCQNSAGCSFFFMFPEKQKPLRFCGANPTLAGMSSLTVFNQGPFCSPINEERGICSFWVQTLRKQQMRKLRGLGDVGGQCLMQYHANCIA